MFLKIDSFLLLNVTAVSNIVDISQLNMKELVRNIEEEEAVRMLNIIMENNTKILELQSMQIILIKRNEEKAKRQEEEQERENRMKENNKKQEEKEHRRRKKERR